MKDTENKIFESETAPEIEIDNNVNKVGFLTDNGEYHVFHDFSISRSRWMAEENEEYLEIEVGKHIVSISGHRLKRLNHLLHKCELFRLESSPSQKHKDYDRKQIAYVKTLEISILEQESGEEYQDEFGI